MPLCTRARRPVQSRWGWAVGWVTPPVVAQRGGPRPVPVRGSAEGRRSQWTGRATRRHPGWPLSTRRRAGLLHPSRPCPPRDHPPNVSIGPYLVIRPEADLALVLGDPSLPPSDRSRAPPFPVFVDAIIPGCPRFLKATATWPRRGGRHDRRIPC